jgi:hypothetical protein
LAEEQQQICKILKDVSKEDVKLLARMLFESSGMRIEGDVLVVYPGGIPVDPVGMSGQSSTSMSRMDKALFRIHLTRIALWYRMVRHKYDTNVAGKDSVLAQMSGKARLVLAYVRKQKMAWRRQGSARSCLPTLKPTGWCWNTLMTRRIKFN